jgi:pimeloyl-ACP methyl ester carboxylesterase
MLSLFPISTSFNPPRAAAQGEPLTIQLGNDKFIPQMNWHDAWTEVPAPSNPGTLPPMSIEASSEHDWALTSVAASCHQPDGSDASSGNAHAIVGVDFVVEGEPGQAVMANITIDYFLITISDLDGLGTADAIVWQGDREVERYLCTTGGQPTTCYKEFSSSQTIKTSFPLLLRAGERYHVGLHAYSHADATGLKAQGIGSLSQAFCDVGINGISVVTHPPLLLVHGYYSSPAMWQSMISYLESRDYVYGRDLFTVDLEPGILPANGDIKLYAQRLSDEIANVKSITGAKKVDLVCHSMGGLVARWYTTHNYRNDVRNLIMIGTPNHGSELLYARFAAKLLPGVWPAVVEFGLGPAGDQMTPHSPFLNTLNYGAWYRLWGTDITNPSVHHEVIAGTDGWPLTSWIFWPELNDGVVRVGSVYLDGWEYYYEVPFDHFNECNNSIVFQWVMGILRNLWPQQIPTAEQALTSPDVSPQEAPMISGTIQTGELHSHSIPVTNAASVTFTLAWAAGNLDLTLTTPSGGLIDPVVAETDPNISYYSDGNITAEAYTVQNPEPGNWQVNVAAIDIPDEGQEYTVFTFLDTTLTLSLNMPWYEYDPGWTVPIVAHLGNGTAPVTGASVTASIERPDESIETIALYDDGLHGDGEANDGVYTNFYANTVTSGTYGITVSANGTADSVEFARQAFATVWVEQYPDLTLTSSDINFSDNAPVSGGNITIEATIHNIGNAEAGNATVSFYDGEPASGMLIGEDTVTVPAGGNATASVSWIPANAGSHEVWVIISPYNEFLEKDYSNNSAYRNIDILEYVVAGITGEVNCDILPFAYIELRQGATVIDSTTSDAVGNYTLITLSFGTYEVIVDKDGWRPQTQQVTVSSPSTVTLDFIGQTGLIPNAPSVQYVAQCSNHYLYPYGNCGLTVQKVAAVSNAYLYPVSE